MKLFLLFTLLILGFGCASSRRPFYPIGIYGVNSTNDFPIIKAAGFNVIAGPAERNYLNAAQQNDLKILASPGTQAGTNFNADAVRKKVQAFDAHPAMWAWYLVDEPDFNRVSPDDVTQANRFVKKLGAKKPTALVLYKGSEALHYGNIADITMIDRYPIPWQPLAVFPQHVGMTRLAAGAKKPVIAVVQAFDWNSDSEHLRGEKNLRAPTYEEMSCMTYAALAERATGLFYFAYKTGWWNIEHSPETWNGLKKIVREVNDRLPLFQAEHVWWPHQQTFSNNEHFKGWNEVRQSAVNVTLLRVKRGNEIVPAGNYLLAVNNTTNSFNYKVTVPTRVAKTALSVLQENREASVTAGWLSDNFSPYAVHVYGPF